MIDCRWYRMRVRCYALLVAMLQRLSCGLPCFKLSLEVYFSIIFFAWLAMVLLIPSNVNRLLSWKFTEPAVKDLLYCNKLFEYKRSYREKGLSYKQVHNRRLRDEQPVVEAS